MAFTKRTYKDNETVITAANLNAIQDELIRVASGFDNGDGGGTTPDLVVVVDGISSDHYVYQLNADDLSIESGSLGDTLTKMENGGLANVLVKLTYIYGTYFYMQFVPENVVATNYEGDRRLLIRFGPLTHYREMGTSPFVLAEITLCENGSNDFALYSYTAGTERVEPERWQV